MFQLYNYHVVEGFLLVLEAFVSAKAGIVAAEVFVFTTEDVTCVNFARLLGIENAHVSVSHKKKWNFQKSMGGWRESSKLKYLKWKDV